jgi:hypothetical protein
MKFFKLIKNLFLLFLLKLKKTHISVDLENGLGDCCCVIYAKFLFGKIYITKRLFYKDGKLIDKSVANLLDLLNGINTIEEDNL